MEAQIVEIIFLVIIRVKDLFPADQPQRACCILTTLIFLCITEIVDLVLGVDLFSWTESLCSAPSHLTIDQWNSLTHINPITARADQCIFSNPDPDLCCDTLADRASFGRSCTSGSNTPSSCWPPTPLRVSWSEQRKRQTRKRHYNENVSMLAQIFVKNLWLRQHVQKEI